MLTAAALWQIIFALIIVAALILCTIVDRLRRLETVLIEIRDALRRDAKPLPREEEIAAPALTEMADTQQ
jgi:hypothetical protein